MTKGQVRHFYPAFRVFVFGQEITDDVLSVSVTLNDARAPSTAEIVLANAHDRYVVTETDILAMVKEVPSSVRLPDLQTTLVSLQEALAELAVTESALGVLGTTSNQEAIHETLLASTETTVEDVTRQIRDRIARVVRDPIKARVLRTKVGERTVVGVPDARIGGVELAATVASLAALRGEVPRYPFQVGESIFHSNDPVRIFFRDPRNPRVWFHMFAGFVTDTVDDLDENNMGVATLRCEDVMRTLRYARISTSPGIIDIDAAATDVDLALRTFFNDDFSDLTLVEFLTTMVFGFDGAGTLETAAATGNVLDSPSLTGKTTVKLLNARGESTQVSINKDGCGFFDATRSIIFTLGETAPDLGTTTLLTAPITELAVYQALVDHQVRVSDLTSMALRSNGVAAIDARNLRQDPRTGTAKIEDVIKSIGEHPEIYPVDGGRLLMLVPAAIGAGTPTPVLLRDFKGVELRTGWKTRLSKIYDVLERIEFSFYATPKGDLVAEMPLHYFDARAFGERQVTQRDVAQAVGEERARTLLDVGFSAGPFAPHYHVARRDVFRYQGLFSDEKVRTLATSEWYNLPGYEAGDTSVAAGSAPARRLLDALVPQFGVRHEEAEPTLYIQGQAAAEVYCQLLLNRFNGEARTTTIDIVPQLRLMPNRPVLFTERVRIATIREVTHHITWGERGDMTTTLRTNYVRGWDGSVDENNAPLFSYLGGFRSDPQNYALILRSQEPASNTAPLRAPTEDNT